MTNYTLEYADGRVTDLVADNDREARECGLARFEPNGVSAADWDSHGPDGRRMLIWETMEIADADDDGSKAVAHIVAVESE